MARTLKLTSPSMHGADVRLLQRTINAQFHRWGVAHEIKVDGHYGARNRDALHTILYGLGIKRTELDPGVTPRLRVKLRRRLLNPAERIRYNARKDWRKRLRHRYDGHGPAAALAWARSQVGVTESPPGSNRGKRIDAWQRLCGILAAPWCGCFVNRALMAAGFPAQPWLRYCPTIEAKAKAGEAGWSWHRPQDAQLGDLPLYGAGEAKHVGIAIGYQDDYEGNTSTGHAGSQDNGGIVAHRTDRDWHSAAFPCRGVARPPYTNRPA
jgi:hypothetical protein